MRNARRLRSELDLWRLSWQKVETLLERIDGARDQDRPHHNKLAALLWVARVVEHQRALQSESPPLSDPVVDKLPEKWYDPGNGTEQGINREQAWSLEYRGWRIPGVDEHELAVANLAMPEGFEEALPVPESVLLGAVRSPFEIRIDADHPDFDPDGNNRLMVRVPSYPGDLVAEDQAVVVDIAGETGSLFSREQRRIATLEPDSENDPVTSWRQLCTARRSALGEADEAELRYVAAGVGPRWGPEQDAAGRSVANQVRANLPDLPLVEASASRLGSLQAAASVAAGVVEADATDLAEAARVLADEGTQAEGFTALLDEAARSFGQAPEAFRAVATAAGELAESIGATPLGQPVSGQLAGQRSAAADALDAALDGLSSALATPTLFALAIESPIGLLGLELDSVLHARLAYPDGTLRQVRALEWVFASSWPAMRRWFELRHSAVLAPLFKRFRRPFVDGLRGLIQGGDTGMPCEGLTLSAPAPVASESLKTDKPGSMLQALEVIETGHIGVFGGDRPGAALILGLTAEGGNIVLNTAPLRLSLDPDAPGAALVPAGEALDCIAPGLSSDELKTGEAASGPGADGLAQETVALWSRLALVFGWALVEQELQGDDGIGDADLHRRLVPEPSSEYLHGLELYGEIPPNTLVLALLKVPAAYWDLVTGEQRLARTGELLLLRGPGIELEGGTGETIQAVVEVETVYPTTGSMLARMDEAGMARLSTESPVMDTGSAPDDCELPCRPDEPVLIMILRRTWLRQSALSGSSAAGPITLRRDFEGIDAPSLAAETLLPTDFVENVVRTEVQGKDIDRRPEFAAAKELLAGWTRYAR